MSPGAMTLPHCHHPSSSRETNLRTQVAYLSRVNNPTREYIKSILFACHLGQIKSAGGRGVFGVSLEELQNLQKPLNKNPHRNVLAKFL